MLFKYTGINSNGVKVKSKIEAVSLDDAKFKLKAKSIIYKTLEEDVSLFSNFDFKRSTSIQSIDLANISRDLSIYLSAGISLGNSIKLICERYKNDKRLYSFFDSLGTFLDEGKNFYTDR